MPTNSVEGAIANLLAKAMALPGMREVPDTPVDQPGDFPWAWCYEATGKAIAQGAGWGSAGVTLVLQIFVSRTMLPPAIRTAMAFRTPLLLSIIQDPTLGGTTQNASEVRWRFENSEVAGVKTTGYRVEIDCRILIQ